MRKKVIIVKKKKSGEESDSEKKLILPESGHWVGVEKVNDDLYVWRKAIRKVVPHG